MAIFVGYILLSLIKNQKRYEQALYEILQYLKMHDSEISISFDVNTVNNNSTHKFYGGGLTQPQYVTFWSKENKYDVVHIPFMVNNLRTSYFRIYHGTLVSNDVKVFGSIAWEWLNILKEHFPSKIHLYQENLDLWEPIYKPLSLKEELRRQVSLFEARKDEEVLFSNDEVEDLLYVFELAIKIEELKAQIILLETMLNSTYISTKQLKLINPDLIDLVLEQNENGSLYKIQQLAIELKSKIEAAKNEIDYVVTLGVDNNSSQFGNTKDKDFQWTESIPEDKTFEWPMNLRVCMFQFSESNNLERITNILQNLWTYSREILFKLIQKYELDNKLIKVIQKYWNGEYGFDLNVSKHGLFQINYLKAISISFDLWSPQLEPDKTSQFKIKSSFDKSLTSLSLIEKLASSGFFELYAQLIEEALIFSYDYTFKVEMPKNWKIYDFLNSSLWLFEALLSHKFIPFMRVILELLEKIRDRLQKVFIKGEKSW